ncbi:AraC family transcriptional regulator [Defluviimonas salinarum]|nr:AraC family transcriptional regulator [Defluviimonas salinarum]MCW3781683.1 AraC family transcriptional regulator [Defluviimonas salinarum]
MNFDHLIALSERYAAKYSGKSEGLPGLFILRKETVSSFEAVIYQPVICLILQGAKETFVGDQGARLQAGDALLVSHDVPVVSRITKASATEPYLALILSLDLALVRSLYERVGEALPPADRARSLSAAPADPAWIDPLGRYLAMMDRPLDARVLGPAVLREVHYRLLMSPIGGMLRNLLSIDSHASRIARAILRIRADFRAPLAVSELARTAGMSPSSFHDHFKSVTGTTPLQYQKDLRLIEARGLLADGRQPVSAVAFAVGYESPTHFSRDYSRKFGRPPSRDTPNAGPRPGGPIGLGVGAPML